MPNSPFITTSHSGSASHILVAMLSRPAYFEYEATDIFFRHQGCGSLLSYDLIMCLTQHHWGSTRRAGTCAQIGRLASRVPSHTDSLLNGSIALCIIRVCKHAPERRRTASAVIDAATGASRSANACTRAATFACAWTVPSQTPHNPKYSSHSRPYLLYKMLTFSDGLWSGHQEFLDNCRTRSLVDVRLMPPYTNNMLLDTCMVSALVRQHIICFTRVAAGWFF